MLDDLSKMMGQLKEAEKNVKNVKKNLENILIEESSGNNQVKVTVTAALQVKAIQIDKNLTDTEEIEDYLMIALNKALLKADNTKEKEIENAAKDGLPNFFG
jgi:DNA-binding YbaB/EbfC family protein